MNLDAPFLVFDVESVGLHGEGFAVGWCVVDLKGGYHADGWVSCPSAKAFGTDEDRAWVHANIEERPDRNNPYEVRELFWSVWRDWAGLDAYLAADVPWPVEARFLAQCVDDFAHNPFDGPYPLLDIASIRFARGFDPLATEPREANELPAHNPLNDARQSARLLLAALSPKETTP